MMLPEDWIIVEDSITPAYDLIAMPIQTHRGPLLRTPGGTRYAMPAMSTSSPDHLPDQCVSTPELLHAALAGDARKEIIFHLAGLLQQHSMERILDLLLLSAGSPLTDAVRQTLQDAGRAYEKHLLLVCECRDDAM